jgi:hypothetical protein
VELEEGTAPFDTTVTITTMTAHPPVTFTELAELRDTHRAFLTDLWNTLLAAAPGLHGETWGSPHTAGKTATITYTVTSRRERRAAHTAADPYRHGPFDIVITRTRTPRHH